MMDRFVYSCVVCWLVVCSCCPSITITIIIIVKRHGHEMRRQRRHTSFQHMYICNIYYTTVSLWLSVCPAVLYMLKLRATTIGPETNLYKHFTEWKPHKKRWRKNGSPLKRIYLYFAKENCFRFLNLSFAWGMRHAQVRQRVELSWAQHVQHLIKYDNT